ncbi:MAG: asparagine synthase (glutamine-hydrolyzing) [Bacteroidota bacterium]
MCGIVGYHSLATYQDTLDDKLKLIAHRGPDGVGIFEEESETHRVAYGHRRLTIIDLSTAANQPFHSNCGRYVIAFNGEIYNYQILKESLTDYTFRTTSDTEVLLNYYIEYGTAAFADLEGMFAFVIYDKEKQETICVRDQLGIKPVYIYQDEQKLVFASEIKALHAFRGIEKEVDERLYTDFLLNGFLYEPETGFKNIQKLFPGSYLIASVQDGKMNYQTANYWTPQHRLNTTTTLTEKIKTSIDRHLMSDVPIGLFFSGGVDSSVLLTQLEGTNIELLTAKSAAAAYEQAGVSSDAYYADKIANHLGKPLTNLAISETVSSNDDFLRAVDQVSQLVEEPIADFTFLSSLELSRLARQKNMIVMLSGMGADEVFAGYDRYRLVVHERFFKLISPLVRLFLGTSSRFSKKIERFESYLKEKDFELKYTSLIGYFSAAEIKKLLPTANIEAYSRKLKKYAKSASNNLQKSMMLDVYGFLSHNFLVADKSSMQASIEMRVPLATAKLLEHTLALPTKRLLSLTKAKLPLRDILYQYLPKKWVNRPKAGFNPPLDNHIQQLGADLLLETYEKNGLCNILDESYIRHLIAQHFDDRQSHNHTYKLYQLLFFSFWLRNNLHA